MSLNYKTKTQIYPNLSQRFEIRPPRNSTRSCCFLASSAASDARRIRTLACTDAADAAAASRALLPGESPLPGDLLGDLLEEDRLGLGDADGRGSSQRVSRVSR